MINLIKCQGILGWIVLDLHRFFAQNFENILRIADLDIYGRILQFFDLKILVNENYRLTWQLWTLGGHKFLLMLYLFEKSNAKEFAFVVALGNLFGLAHNFEFVAYKIVTSE